MSAPYLDQRRHQHQIYTRGNGIVGTTHSVSINTHENSILCLMAVGNGHCFAVASSTMRLC
jgi:hypothetical protein